MIKKTKTKTEASQFKWVKWKNELCAGLQMVTSVRLVDWWGFIPRNGDFYLWFDWWRLLPMVWLMASFAAYGLINGDFCHLWFDWWRFLPMVCWMATFAYGSIDGVFCRLWFDWWRLLPVVWLNGRMIDWWIFDWCVLSREMATSAYGSRDGDSYLWSDWCILSLRNDGFCQDPDRWALSPKNGYCTVNWDVILGRIPISGLIIGLIPHQLVWIWVWIWGLPH